MKASTKKVKLKNSLSKLEVVKTKTGKQIFEEFYNKPYEKITLDDIGYCEEIDFGKDVGEEIVN